jgi:hypothetical protein
VVTVSTVAVPRLEGRGSLAHAGVPRFVPAGRAQGVVTRNRLLMRTLSAVYEIAPSQIRVRQRLSCAGCSDRDRCSKRRVSTWRQCPKHSWNAYTQG